MKNEDVIKAFLNGEYAETKNLKSEDNKLFSYSTCIAQLCMDWEFIVVNMTYYSLTTSTHRNKLIRAAKEMRYKLIEINDINKNAKQLI